MGNRAAQMDVKLCFGGWRGRLEVTDPFSPTSLEVFDVHQVAAFSLDLSNLEKTAVW